jgi:hypothetical protein
MSTVQADSLAELDELSSDPDEARSQAFAAMGNYPNRSPCPVGCKFCYERSLPEFYPKLKVAMVRPKSESQFDFYAMQVEKYRTAAVPISPVTLEDNGMVTYHSNSDFFAQGLTLEQLDRIVAANTTAGAAPYVSTMGKGFDFETAKFLQEKHPDAFRVRLSVLTYNDEIKANLIPRWQDSTDMRKITSILRYAHIYLLHFNCEQTLIDLREVNRLANVEHKPNIGIAVVHYTRKHSPQVQQYAKDGFADFESMVRYLMSGKESFDNLGEIYFQHPAEGFTFRFRNFLRAKVAQYLLCEDDLLLCSQGAYEIMRTLVVKNGATVRPVRDNLGGSTNFTTTLCTDDFLRDLRAVLDEPRDRPFKRVLIPLPVWWVSDKTCLNGGTIEDLQNAFPMVEIVPVDIPMDVLESRLSIREAYDWYNVDLERSAKLQAMSQAEVAACLGPNEVVTEMGFVRRFVLEDTGETIDPAHLSDHTSVMVEYDELLVEREALYPVEGSDRRYTLTLAGQPVSVRRTLTRRYPLPGRYMISLYKDLFITKRSLADVAASALGDLPDRLYQTLCDLERRHPVTPAKRRLPLAAAAAG